MIPLATLRATYTCWWWPTDEPDTDPWTWGGFCDPQNPWGTADDTPREVYSVDGDEPIELHLPVYEAAEFIRDFPGAVWDLRDMCDMCAPDQSFRNGAYTNVTLHVSGDAGETALELASVLMEAQKRRTLR